MNITKPPHRQNHTGILIEGEAQLDLEIGFLKILSEKNPNLFETIPPFDDYKKLIDIKKSDRDFLYRWFKKNISRETINEIHIIYKEEHAGEIITAAPEVPSVQRLLQFSAKLNKDIAFCVLILKNPIYCEIYKSRFPNLTYLEAPRTKDFDFKPYARFIIEDIDGLVDYGKIEFTYITVMDYAKNYMEVSGKKILKSSPVLVYGVMNEFNIMDPLLNINGGR